MVIMYQTRGWRVNIIFRIEIYFPPFKSKDYINILNSGKMGVTNLQSKTENGRNKKCKI